jgi:hypothetical protein
MHVLSPRSSPRGEPRTWRRGTVDEYGGAVAGVSGVYRICRGSSVAPERATQGGKPGGFRLLGIPTVKDRAIQAAMKQMMEPIFEAER